MNGPTETTWKGIVIFGIVLLFVGWLVVQIRGCAEHHTETNAKARMDQKREVDRTFRFGKAKKE